MIKAVIVFNNQGKPRLTKFFTYYVSTHTSRSLRNDLIALSISL